MTVTGKKFYLAATLLLLLLPLLILILSASYTSAGGIPAGKELTLCTDPRSKACTRDYRPVCAQLNSEALKTYPNACTACADTAVNGHRAGACEDILAMVEPTICTEPRPQICTMDYRPVCAKLSDGTFKTYSNGCTACSDPVVSEHREGMCGD